MKDEILKQLCSEQSVIRVVFATVALGMGVDIKELGALFISPLHIPFRHTFRRLVVQAEMENQHLPFFITAIEILQKIKLACKML